MPFGLIVILQIICGIHVVRTGQERYWLFIIIFLPAIGCAVYLLAVVLPGLFGSHHGRRVMRKAQDHINPERNVRELRNELALAPTSENYRLLADELMRIGQPSEAVELYEKSLSGVFANDPHIMVKLAGAQFENNNPQACRETLESLIKLHPDFRSAEGHLLFARANEECGYLAQAEEEYDVLVQYFSGPEARYRYAKLLIKMGKIEKAQQELEDIVFYARRAPSHYRKLYKYWINQAEKELKALTSGNALTK